MAVHIAESDLEAELVTKGSSGASPRPSPARESTSRRVAESPIALLRSSACSPRDRCSSTASA